MATWQCVKQCGACCYLDPSERPDLEDYLTPEQLSIYLGMVGEDGWCINFDRDLRNCQIYDTRPEFCRVRVDTFTKMFGIEPEELNDFAIDCCHEQIDSIYGEDSPEMANFDRAIGMA
jgi:uncharacterized protein